MKVASIAIHERGFIGRTQTEMLNWVREKCLSLKSLSPDIIVFPEVVFIMYPPHDPTPYDEFFSLALEEMKKTAAEVASYVIFNIHEPHDSNPDYRYITTFMLSRTGEIVGKYRKMHTVDVETIENRIIPGEGPCVVDTEFGKIGIATCFDIGWRSYWQKMKDMGAKAVIWTSAYDGGNLLDAYAVTNMYWVISSVRTCHARIIDPVGRTVAESAIWDNLCFADIDLDMEIFHIDNQAHKIHDIRKELGDTVDIRTLSEENVFTVSSKNPDWSIDRIKKEFGLVTYCDYHMRAEEVQNEWRNKKL